MIRDCDAPMSLVNLTFEWLQKEWANEVDFVVCTSTAAVFLHVAVTEHLLSDDFTGTGDNARCGLMLE